MKSKNNDVKATQLQKQKLKKLSTTSNEDNASFFIELQNQESKSSSRNKPTLKKSKSNYKDKNLDAT
ncbi:hypothetical protein [Flavobacterium sp.]|uniref:hypothetical protein n=1 Tax=Flavobacterium sp. TaxID=239 RepID=UPI00261C6F5D|nr:hypothetical protein [Flavobacterium sp.]